MIEIISIKPCDGGDGFKVVCMDDGVKNTYAVSADFLLENGISKGCIDDDFHEVLIFEDKSYAAKRAAIRMITSSQCSANRLYTKLRSRGFPHECAKNATDFIKEKGYIDEDWQIENYLRILVEKKYFGRRKVLPMLLAKGYEGMKISASLDRMYSDEDFKKLRAEFLFWKFGKTKPETSAEALEMKKALYKQGY